MSTVVSENRVVISPNGTLFDLPEIVALERGLFGEAGLDVAFAVQPQVRGGETEAEPLLRLKESLFENGEADVYNLCEWGGIDRLERDGRGGRIAFLRPAVAAQALITFDPTLDEVHDSATSRSASTSSPARTTRRCTCSRARCRVTRSSSSTSAPRPCGWSACAAASPARSC